MPTLPPVAQNPFTSVRIKCSVATPQLSASLTKVRFSLSGAPAGSTVTATLMRNGAVIGTTTLPVGTAGLRDARVAVSPSARPALKRFTGVRLRLALNVTNGSTVLSEQSFALTLRRQAGK